MLLFTNCLEEVLSETASNTACRKTRPCGGTPSSLSFFFVLDYHAAG